MTGQKFSRSGTIVKKINKTFAACWLTKHLDSDKENLNEMAIGS